MFGTRPWLNHRSGLWQSVPNIRLEVISGARIAYPDLALVELTGIEPVASWLQTRRSPS